MVMGFVSVMFSYTRYGSPASKACLKFSKVKDVICWPLSCVVLPSDLLSVFGSLMPDDRWGAISFDNSCINCSKWCRFHPDSHLWQIICTENLDNRHLSGYVRFCLLSTPFQSLITLTLQPLYILLSKQPPTCLFARTRCASHFNSHTMDHTLFFTEPRSFSLSPFMVVNKLFQSTASSLLSSLLPISFLQAHLLRLQTIPLCYRSPRPPRLPTFPA